MQRPSPTRSDRTGSSRTPRAQALEIPFRWTGPSSSPRRKSRPASRSRSPNAAPDSPAPGQQSVSRPPWSSRASSRHRRRPGSPRTAPTPPLTQLGRNTMQCHDRGPTRPEGYAPSAPRPPSPPGNTGAWSACRRLFCRHDSILVSKARSLHHTQSGSSRSRGLRRSWARWPPSRRPDG